MRFGARWRGRRDRPISESRDLCDNGRCLLNLLASDVLVMPYSSKVTIRDGTEAGKFTSPLKLFEYMAAAKPIVATGVPAVLEILKPGENSVVTPPDDEGKFIQALELVLADSKLCARISEGVRSDAVGYTWERRVERIIGGIGIGVE